MTLSLLIKATALLVVALAAVRLARRARASVRHAMLAVTFVALAALPAAMMWLPAWQFAVLPRTEGGSPASPGFRLGAEGFGGLAGGTPPLRSADQSVAEGTAVLAVARLSTKSVVAALWLAGAASVLLTLIVSGLRLQRLRRAALPFLERRRHLPALVHAAGIATPVDVVVHEAVNAPITCGIRRATIVLPPDAANWPDAALTRALVHELEHVKRRDWIVQILAHAVCAIYWFHPLVWSAYRQLCLQAEHACDDAVVMREEETGYAEQLVTLARRMAARPAVGVLGMAERSDLAARVSAVLDASRVRGRAGVLRASAIAGSALALLLTLAPLQLVASTNEGAIAAGGMDAAPDRDQGDVASALRLRDEAANTAIGELRGRLLVEASDEGDLHRVRELLDEGANVNAAMVGDGSPLIAAARGGHRDVVQLLLERGAEVNLGVPGDGAPLIMAARGGHLTIVQLLLDRGAEVDLIVAGDENALIQASGAGQLDVVRLLVARGANVNARVWADRGPGRSQGEWRTPLNMALNGGHRRIADFLRASGAIE